LEETRRGEKERRPLPIWSLDLSLTSARVRRSPGRNPGIREERGGEKKLRRGITLGKRK